MRNKLVLLPSLVRAEALAGDKQAGSGMGDGEIGVGEEYQRRVKEAISISSPRQSWAVPRQFLDSQGHTTTSQDRGLLLLPQGQTGLAGLSEMSSPHLLQTGNSPFTERYLPCWDLTIPSQMHRTCGSYTIPRPTPHS